MSKPSSLKKTTFTNKDLAEVSSTFAGIPNSSSTHEQDSILSRYIIESEKVPVRLVRNCGILLEHEDEGFSEISLKDSTSKPHKKESLAQNAYKIPVEIQKNSRYHPSKKGWRKYGGIIFAVFASLCFSLTVLLAKVLQDQHDFHPISITVWRYLGILIPAIPIALYFQFFTDEEIFDSIWPMKDLRNVKNACGYIMQGIFGCTSIIFRFYALEFLTVADTSVISYSSPVVVTIFAHFLLKEKCGIVSILISFLTAVGVVIIAKPPLLIGGASNESKIWIGAMLAVASMICASGLLILLRTIRHVHFSLLLLVSGSWGVLQSTVMGFSLSIMKHPETMKQGFLIGLLCFLTFCGQISLILALKYENAGPVAAVRSSEVLFAFVWQRLFLGVYPDVFSLGGAGIIIFAVVVTALKKWVAGLPQDNAQRRRFGFLMK